MRISRLLLVVPLFPLASARAGAQPGETACLLEAREWARTAFEAGATREAARRELEVAAARCFDPELSPAGAHLVGTVNADRARFARDLLAGRLTLVTYRALMRDRRDKLAELLHKPRRQRQLLAGDGDGDLVPDRRDRCRETPDGTPTDARGCPRPARPRDAEERRREEEDERALRATLAGVKVLSNRSCDGASEPLIPAPLAWGRGPQTRLGTHGFNFLVARVTGQPESCEVFYEVQLRFSEPNPGNPALPSSKYVTVVWSESEDLLHEPRRVVLPLPSGPPLSPGRTSALAAMQREYGVLTWRVRAVNGNHQTSHWSPFVTQRAASAGVDG